MTYLSFFDAIRPSWRRVIASLVLAYVFGWITGPLLRWYYSCWDGPKDTSCDAYSPIAAFIAQVISWPVLTTKSAFAPTFNSDNIFPWASPAFLLVWFYYYAVVAGVEYLIRCRNRTALSS